MPAQSRRPMVHQRSGVRGAGDAGAALAALSAEIVRCRACPRLVAWREQVARSKRAAYAGEEYWGRPVPGFGDPGARLVIVGLAPAAHGGNRTGRVFTGDRSGDWLYAALHRAGYANQPTSRDREDGLVLRDAYIMAVVRCAPPDNKPTIDERDRCLPFLERELALLSDARVFVALGKFAWDVLCHHFGLMPRPRFGHAAEVSLDPAPYGVARTLLGSYHPSQQNTFTGRLTEAAFDRVFERARLLLT